MRSPIQVVVDWTAVRKLKLGLLDALRKTRPGAGITIKNPQNPIVARTLIEILREHPNEIEATDFGFEVTLMRKVDQHKTLGAKHDEMVQTFDVLTADNLTKIGLGGKAELPFHKFRQIDEATFNGDGPQWDLFDKRRGKTKPNDDLAQIDQSVSVSSGGGDK